MIHPSTCSFRVFPDEEGTERNCHLGHWKDANRFRVFPDEDGTESLVLHVKCFLLYSVSECSPMKRGLKVISVPVNHGLSRRFRVFPDEEGTESYSVRLQHRAHAVRFRVFPDEEGTESFHRDLISPQRFAVSECSPMKRGLKGCYCRVRRFRRSRVSECSPMKRGLKAASKSGAAFTLFWFQSVPR